jgi:hypothetical protein
MAIMDFSAVLPFTLSGSIQTCIGQLNGLLIALRVMDFKFMGGSMGSVLFYLPSFKKKVLQNLRNHILDIEYKRRKRERRIS